jgi:trk system potassium uptake protein TrkH
MLIQIGGLGVITIATFIVTFSQKKISLLQRNALQDSISAPQLGGVVKLTKFIFLTTIIVELVGAIAMLPTFISKYGAHGIWMSIFHSISAFCNAGFDIMGDISGQYSSLTALYNEVGIVIPIGLLIIIGGLGYLTWDDILKNRFHFHKYKMQSKVVLISTTLLIIVPAILMFIFEFSDYPILERINLSLFQAITPRTAGFNTADFANFTGVGRTLIIFLMFIGGSPGSTAGGMKTTTFVVVH